MKHARSCRALGLRARLRTVAGVVVLAAVAACFTSCATLEGLDPWTDSHSFAGVSFGDSQAEVTELYPHAEPATSPYGAQMLLVSNLESGGLRFKRVVFEFSAVHGMQLVAASFDPSMAAPLYQKLCEAFGRQLRVARGRPIRARWVVADGTSVGMDGARGRLFFVGPHGGALRKELPLLVAEWNF